MSEIASRGPHRPDLRTLTHQEFEELCFRLARLEAPGVEPMASPDGGADALLRAPGCGFERAWQAKHHCSGIDWRKCEASLERALDTYGIRRLTFCFPIDLTSSAQRHLESLRHRHPGLEIDYWARGEILARLAGSPEGKRVARHYFEDSVETAELITRTLRAGGELASVEDAVERVRPIGEFLDQDPFFSYPLSHYAQGEGPPVAPGTMISVEYPEEGRVVRIDAVPRDAEAADRFPARMRVVLSGRACERFERARRRGDLLRLERGANVTWESLPPAFASSVGESFDAGLSIDFRPDPWQAEFRALTAVSEESLQLRMDPVSAPTDWDRAYEGRLGGLTITLQARLGIGHEAVSLKWMHRSDGSPAREQLAALRFLAAMHEEGEMVLRECEEGQQLLRESNEQAAIDARLPSLISLLEDVVSIEDWIGSDIAVPSEISGEEIETIARIASAVRAGCAPFHGEAFELIGDRTAIPAFRRAGNVGIGERWVEEIFGERLELGWRTVHFRPLSVSEGEEVEPGRSEVMIVPGPLGEEEGLHWCVERPVPVA